MKKLCVAVLAAISFVDSYSQTLYVPSGTSGIGSSSTSNVGIGTSSPNNLLTVSGTGALGSTFQQKITTGSQTLALGANSTAAEVQSQGAVPLYINYGGNNVIMNATGGNVGIGITNPAFTLDVQGLGTRIKNTSNASNAYTTFRVQGPDYANGLEIDFFGNNNLSSDPIFSYSGGAGSAAIVNVNAKPLVFGTGNQARILIDGTGNVGIGTISPDNLLQIHSSNVPTLAIGKGNLNTNGKSSLLFNAGDGTAFNGFSVNYFKTTATDRLGFVDGGGVEGLSVLNGGKVSVGNTNPIYGRFQVTQLSDASDQGIAILNSTGSRAMRIWTDVTNSYVYSTGNGSAPLILNGAGNVGIGTTHPDYPLTVNGSIHAKEVRVDLSVPGPDYVFEKDYKLTSLEDIKNYIDQNKHLPEIPSATEMEKNGVQLGEMNMLLLKKIEELTLHVIEQNGRMEDANKKIEEQQKQIEDLKKLLTK